MQRETRTEHDKIYDLMMGALDGELQDYQLQEMEAHLQHCPSCAMEWQTIQAIHHLFQQAPILSPAADFTQRTLARLPNTRLRTYTLGAVYAFLLLIGFLPLAVVVWFGFQFAPALGQPVFVQGVVRAGGQLLSVFETILQAIWQGLGTFGQFVGQQPAVIGWMLVMLGVVFLWGGVYRQLTRQQGV